MPENTMRFESSARVALVMPGHPVVGGAGDARYPALR